MRKKKVLIIILVVFLLSVLLFSVSCTNNIRFDKKYFLYFYNTEIKKFEKQANYLMFDKNGYFYNKFIDAGIELKGLYSYNPVTKKAYLSYDDDYSSVILKATIKEAIALEEKEYYEQVNEFLNKIGADIGENKVFNTDIFFSGKYLFTAKQITCSRIGTIGDDLTKIEGVYYFHHSDDPRDFETLMLKGGKIFLKNGEKYDEERGEYLVSGNKIVITTWDKDHTDITTTHYLVSKISLPVFIDSGLEDIPENVCKNNSKEICIFTDQFYCLE